MVSSGCLFLATVSQPPHIHTFGMFILSYRRYVRQEISLCRSNFLLPDTGKKFTHFTGPNLYPTESEKSVYIALYPNKAAEIISAALFLKYI